MRSVGFSNQGEIRIPPLLLAQLILGYRSIKELKAIYPDVSVWGEGQYLVDVLVPQVGSVYLPNLLSSVDVYEYGVG